MLEVQSAKNLPMKLATFIAEILFILFIIFLAEVKFEIYNNYLTPKSQT
jgi:hypothetical protein